MGRWILSIVGGTAAIAVVLLGAFTLGFRRKWPALLDRVRRFNRDVTNPRQLHTAGTPGGRAVVVHVGRRSGRTYRTPVGAFPTPEGFAVGLPYGPGTDWVRNLLAAGGGTVEYEGRVVTVERPEVTTRAATAAHFNRLERMIQRLYGVEDVLLLREAVQIVA